ncbi:MAG: ABC transporter permease [Acidimicrobiia bacterium]|nr:ABC transporter permease [Acidimicrobiia bacterium]
MTDQIPPLEPTKDNGDEPSDSRRFFEDITGINVDWRTALMVPFLAILSALIVGAFVMVMTDIDILKKWPKNPGGAAADSWDLIYSAYQALAKGAFGSVGAWSETVIAATPLVFAGLAVAIGFRAGLFNIGGQGQLIMGGMLATIVGFQFASPSFIHIPLALFAGVLGGAIWGGIPGILRARTGAHEVITTIMMNFIALFLMNWALKTSFVRVEDRIDPLSKVIETSAKLPRLLAWLDRPELRIHAGFLVALLVAGVIWWLLFRSTIGYEFRATGFNPDAARYAGINVNRTYVMVMAVAGAAAGLAGASEVMGLHHRLFSGFQGTIGFDAIALALLGRSHPAGVVAASLLFGALKAGGRQMQAATDIPIDLILVVQALVIIFIAAPALIRAIYRVRTGEGTGVVTRGWST